MRRTDKPFKFIDLFCGLGGFHQAMVANGGQCVFACDIDEQCRAVYKQNFCPNDEFPIEGDIIDVIKNKTIPDFNFLCAGFPCQTFSKAGNRNGFAVIKKANGKDDQRGRLFFSIIEILKKHTECQYFLLENVRNLSDNKENWAIICEELNKLDFIISEEPIVESPHHFGVPQIRERVYILGIRKSHFDHRKPLPKGFITRSTLHLDKYLNYCDINSSCINSILEDNVSAKYNVTDDINSLLLAWEELRVNTRNLSHPFWLQYAGIGIKSRNDFYSNPSIMFDRMPLWKQKIVLRIRDYYEDNMVYIDKWVKKHKMLDRIRIHQKFEWNAGELYSMRDCVIQIRQSGVRVKKPNYFPSLVAMNNTAIIWDTTSNHYRFLTPIECAKLQSFNADYKFSEIDHVTYRQLGNSVNVKVLTILAKELLGLGKKSE